MRRLAWVTDPHLDHADAAALDRFRDELDAASADGLVVTGDIAESMHLLRSLDWLREAHSGPFWFCLGNHDFYYDGVEPVRRSVEKWAVDNAAWYLTGGGPQQLTEQIGLVGHDGWADGRTPCYERSLVFMHDTRLIADLAGLDKRARWDVMMRLADESADRIEQVLTAAFERWSSVIVATHVPPFREACWYDGRISDDHWAPHFTNVALGERLLELMQSHPSHQAVVLCGHTHGSGSFRPLANLAVETGAAEYGRPSVTRVIDLEEPLF